MKNIRTLTLILGAISFIIVIGGAVYEHLAIVPVWTSAVPASLSMMQGEYAITPTRFWMPIHPVTLLLLILGLFANWRSGARNFIIVALVGYVMVLLVTFLFFVPELMALTQTAYSTTVDADLTRRAKNWEVYSLIRLCFLILLAVVLLFGVAKVSEQKA
ncbi:MAG: DUF1772 domain-containing protein [Acidobacteria bacterium]|nr:DUF1772 domain-containing protein [Acidobacteriota bacterium]